MVRHTKWKTGIDWELCKKEERDWPSIATSHCILSTDQITSVDEMLHKLDESLPSFSFPVEGLDLPGAAGSYIHPENAVIVSEIVNNRLCRITRFCYIELAWIPIESAWTKLDRCWTSLFETLMDIAQVSALPATSVVEKYDTDPAAFAENLRTAAKKEESEE
ncbi:MAG TPA: hypothetical protein DDY78_28145 [Planctomycetales bacterium]|nr:hypothetical protein [Planctomycetales bacterium]